MQLVLRVAVAVVSCPARCLATVLCLLHATCACRACAFVHMYVTAALVYTLHTLYLASLLNISAAALCVVASLTT
jgi:hypothetical protein